MLVKQPCYIQTKNVSIILKNDHLWSFFNIIYTFLGSVVVAKMSKCSCTVKSKSSILRFVLSAVYFCGQIWNTELNSYTYNLQFLNLTFLSHQHIWPTYMCMWHSSRSDTFFHSKSIDIHFIWASAWQNLQNGVRPGKTQISLGIHPVCSVFAMRSLGS